MQIQDFILGALKPGTIAVTTLLYSLYLCGVLSTVSVVY